MNAPHPGRPIYPYLLRGVTTVYPNQIWGIDIGYSHLIIDWYSRYVVAWELSETWNYHLC